MGSSFTLGVVETNEGRAMQLLAKGVAEIQRIENLLSEFKDDSVTSIINKSAGNQQVDLSSEVLGLIDRCIKISNITKGKFDITVGPLKKIYQFNNKEFIFPDKELIAKTLQLVGYEKIELDRNAGTIFLKENNMKISFAAIGKGYAADAVMKKWKEAQLKSGFVNSSGDLTASGSNVDGKPWKIGIANPDDKKKILFYVPLNNCSVATSGDYEQFFIYKGKRYSHNINPLTGMPLSGIKSVSVFSPGAELSDALATAVYAMGVDQGISFVNQLPKTHCVIIDDHNKIYFSKNLKYEEVA